MADDNFTVWLARPTWWPRPIPGDRWALDMPYEEGDAPRKIAGPFSEPAEAADVAESVLDYVGSPNHSFAEIRFNGDEQPHTVIFLLDDGVFGVWNTESARWPFHYPPGSPHGTSVEGWPEGIDPADYGDENGEDDADDDTSGFGDEDEDSDLMDLSRDMEEGEDATDWSDEDDNGTDDEIEEEDEDDDADEGDEEEAEEEDGGEAEEDDDDSEFHDDEDDGDSTDDEDEEADEDAEDEEMPRLNIFAKMRGPKGWRKRADAEELMERNVFALKVGVLDPDEELTPAKRERELVAHVEFVESDDDREAGLLRLKLPTGVALEDFKQLKSGWITARVPYRRDDAQA